MTGLVAPAEEREQCDERHERSDDSHRDKQGVEAHGSNASTMSRSRKLATSLSRVAVRTLNRAFHRISLLSRFQNELPVSAAVHAATPCLGQLPA